MDDLTPDVAPMGKLEKLENASKLVVEIPVPDGSLGVFDPTFCCCEAVSKEDWGREAPLRSCLKWSSSSVDMGCVG